MFIPDPRSQIRIFSPYWIPNLDTGVNRQHWAGQGDFCGADRASRGMERRWLDRRWLLGCRKQLQSSWDLWYRVTLFLRTISRNVYRGALQAMCFLGPNTERIYLWFEKFLVEKIMLCYFELCLICLREGLGRSNPATNRWNKHNNTTVGISTVSKPYWTVFYRIKWALQGVSELGYLFLTLSSLHIIASDLDVRDHCCGGWCESLNDVKSYNTIKGFVTINKCLL